MSYYIPFNSKKRKMRLNTDTAKRVALLGKIMDKMGDKFVNTSKIREEVKISNNLLWQLAYMGFLRVSVKRFRRQDGLCVQMFRWKANQRKFQEFNEIVKFTDKDIIEKKKEKEEMNSVNLVEILQNPEMSEVEEDD